MLRVRCFRSEFFLTVYLTNGAKEEEDRWEKEEEPVAKACDGYVPEKQVRRLLRGDETSEKNLSSEKIIP